MVPHKWESEIKLRKNERQAFFKLVSLFTLICCQKLALCFELFTLKYHYALISFSYFVPNLNSYFQARFKVSSKFATLNPELSKLVNMEICSH